MSRKPQLELDDLVFVAPKEEIRIFVSVSGRYSLADRGNARGERVEVACRAVYVSPSEIALAGPVDGKVGERVIAHIDHLGKVEGLITRLITGGFMMSVAASDEGRGEFAAKIEWLESYKNHDTPNRRAHERAAPQNLHSKLIFADGRIEKCRILDLSVSGAAIAAATAPDIGTFLGVGSVVGRVVRHFAGGFGVQFVER
jgi:hypothetical protein